MTESTRGTYHQVVGYFRTKILSGELPPGARMPTLRKVCDQFKISMATANRAYQVLKNDGLTVASSGSGTSVAYRPAVVSSPSIADRVRRHAETGRALREGEVSRIVRSEVTAADEVVAERLGVAPGHPVQVRVRVVSRNGTVSHLSSSYYPSYVMNQVPELSGTTSTGGSRELASERLGSPQDRASHDITSRPAYSEELDLLGLEEGTTVLVDVRTVYLEDDRVVEVAVKVCPGTGYLHYEEQL
jgi:GntR family transcriptional regulator